MGRPGVPRLEMPAPRGPVAWTADPCARAGSKGRRRWNGRAGAHIVAPLDGERQQAHYRPRPRSFGPTRRAGRASPHDYNGRASPSPPRIEPIRRSGRAPRRSAGSTPGACAKHSSGDRHECGCESGLGKHDEHDEQAWQAEEQARHQPGDDGGRTQRLHIVELNRSARGQGPTSRRMMSPVPGGSPPDAPGTTTLTAWLGLGGLGATRFADGMPGPGGGRLGHS